MTKKKLGLSSKDDQRHHLEATLTALAKEWLEAQPDIKLTKISDRYKKGIPDFILCVSGVYVALELKAANGTASPHQELHIKETIRAGGIGGVCYTMGQVKKLVDAAREKFS